MVPEGVSPAQTGPSEEEGAACAVRLVVVVVVAAVLKMGPKKSVGDVTSSEEVAECSALQGAAG